MMYATVNREICIGCGLCADACPEVFQMDADNLAEVVAQPTEANYGSAQEAADGCPVDAIEVGTAS